MTDALIFILIILLVMLYRNLNRKIQILEQKVTDLKKLQQNNEKPKIMEDNNRSNIIPIHPARKQN